MDTMIPNSTSYYLFLSIGLFLAFYCVLSPPRGGRRVIPLLLFLCSISLVYSFAIQDPYLNMWDERFHALVAKNMQGSFLTPALYRDPVIAADYSRWDRSVIWLHKPPFFLWQISLCYMLGGESEFTTRIPSIIGAGILVMICYRAGYLLFSQRTGYFAAIICTSNYYLIELVSGRMEVDHCDVAFLLYCSLSFWALIEYFHSGNRNWVILLGLFSGVAILCKWLVGLVVYFSWVVFILGRLFHRRGIGEPSFLWRELRYIALSAFVTSLVAAPWFIYTFHHFSPQTTQSIRFFGSHFHSIIEGHGGVRLFHLLNFHNLYGVWAAILFPFGIFLSWKKTPSKPIAMALISLPVAIYLFFSWSDTKMPGYPFVVAMIVFVLLGLAVAEIVTFLQRCTNRVTVKTLLEVTVVAVLLILNIQYFRIREKQSLTSYNGYCRLAGIQNKKVFAGLKGTVPANTVVFNVKGRTYVDCMFYSDLIAYNFIPSYSQYKELKRKGRNILVFVDSGEELPPYLRNDPSVMVRHDGLRSCDQE